MRTLTYISLVIILAACNNREAQFNPTDLSQVTTYKNDYENGRLISNTETISNYLNGEVIDTLTFFNEYIYNEKGLLAKEIGKNAEGQEISVTIFSYNEIDSLIKKMTIYPDNDTAHWFEYVYFPDGRRILFDRILPPGYSIDSKVDKANMIWSRYEYEYSNNFCQNKKEYNQKGELVKKINYFYNDNQLVEEVHLVYIGGLSMTEKFVFYNYSNSIEHPDFYALDHLNDTIELQKNIFEEGKIVLKSHAVDYGKAVMEEHYENNLLVKVVFYDMTIPLRTSYLYAYDQFNNETMVTTYTEGTLVSQ